MSGTTPDQAPAPAPDALERWARQAAKAAPGGDLQALNWRTPEGIVVKPLYTAADLENLMSAADYEAETA